MLPSVAGRTSTFSLDTDSLGLALSVAFGYHGSRKDEEKCKHLASRCRNLTGFPLDFQPAFVTVTGKERQEDGGLSLRAQWQVLVRMF